MTIRDEDMSQLASMGFAKGPARNALQKTDGNLEMAIDRLLSGDYNASSTDMYTEPISSVEPVSPASSVADSIVRGSKSQYSFGSDGRSACTCIALTIADIVANMRGRNNGNNSGSIITTELLDRSIEEGVSRYKKIRNESASLVEHLSAEEILRKDDERVTTTVSDNNNRNDKLLFNIQLLSAAGGEPWVRQGLLSRDTNHPLGMKVVLEGLLNDVQEEQQNLARRKEHDGKSEDEGNSNTDQLPMICILLTKSPETVLLCLPPANYEDHTTNTPNHGAATQKQEYWLIDSHPRPQLLPGVETSYAKPHTTFDSLLQTLQAVFPFTDLGPDVPSMMSEVYNMFDLYALEAR